MRLALAWFLVISKKVCVEMFSVGLRRGVQAASLVATRVVPVLQLQRVLPVGAQTLGVRGVKTSTGIVGLPFDPNGRQTLIAMAQQVLDTVQVLN